MRSPPLLPLGNVLRDRTGGRSEMISFQSGAERSQTSLLWPVVSQSSTQVFPEGKNRRRVHSGIAHTRLANTVWLGRSLLYLVLLGQIVLMRIIALGVHLVKLEVPSTPQPLVTVVVTFDGLTVVVWGVTGASCKFLIELQPLRNLTLDTITVHSLFLRVWFFLSYTNIVFSETLEISHHPNSLTGPVLVCFFSVSVCLQICRSTITSIAQILFHKPLLWHSSKKKHFPVITHSVLDCRCRSLCLLSPKALTIAVVEVMVSWLSPKVYGHWSQSLRTPGKPN